MHDGNKPEGSIVTPKDCPRFSSLAVRAFLLLWFTLITGVKESPHGRVPPAPASSGVSMSLGWLSAAGAIAAAHLAGDRADQLLDAGHAAASHLNSF